MGIAFVRDVVGRSQTRNILWNVKKVTGKNESVTYIPSYEDLFGNPEEDLKSFPR